MRVERRNVRGEDGKLTPRWYVGCGGCDATLDFDGKKNVQTDHLGHMVRGKGWTFDRHGGTCPQCQGKAKTADVIHLQFADETTYGAAPGDAGRFRHWSPPAAARPVRRHAHSPSNPEFQAELRPYLDAGWTDREAAEVVGCSHAAVWEARKAMGLPSSREISANLRKGNPDMGEVKPMTPPQPTTVPTIRETVLISEKLDTFFDIPAGRYKAPWTDQKIGEALNLPAAKVAAVRAGLEMHLRGDPELQALREELGAVEKMLAELRQRLERAERKAGEGNIR